MAAEKAAEQSPEANAQRLLAEHSNAVLPPAKLPAHERLRAFNEFVQGFESHAMEAEEAFHSAKHPGKTLAANRWRGARYRVTANDLGGKPLVI